MVFGLYVSLSTNSIIRYKDGVYDLIHSPSFDETENYDYINAPGYSCDQSWAENVQKENLIVSQAMAQVFYRIPDGVQVITTLNGVETVARKHIEPTDEPERPPEADEIEIKREIAEIKAGVAQEMKKFSAEDQKALRHIATDAMSGNNHARDVLAHLFPGVKMGICAYYMISDTGFNAMTPHEQEVDYIVATRNLQAIPPDDEISQAPSVAARRLELNMTQKQLAEKSGINVRQIQKIESGEVSIRNITLASATALAKALDISVEDLMK